MTAPETLRAAVALLVERRRPAYLAAAGVTAVNTVPDVVRKVLVWDDPSVGHALLVAVIGVLTATLAQLWLTGALVDLPRSGSLRLAGALGRGVRLAVRAISVSPGRVLAGLVVGGATSALLTFPASVWALGWDRMLGPLDSPGVGAFAVAAVSDVIASVVTLPFLSLVLILTAGLAVPAAGRDRS